MVQDYSLGIERSIAHERDFLMLCCASFSLVIFVFYVHAGPRITVPRSLRWAACGAISVSSASALLVCLFSPECEQQNIAAYDNRK